MMRGSDKRCHGIKALTVEISEGDEQLFWRIFVPNDSFLIWDMM